MTTIGKSLTGYQQITQWRARQRELNQSSLETQNALFGNILGAGTSQVSGLMDITVQRVQTRLKAEQNAKIAAMQKQIADLKL
ncbi:hypothetical protein [Chthonobacter albigriseus]|uniref:hypothetical protein n=1 Tax=Chthonobacter albigriseus TaxID=1683161 RepID=UPI0015EF9569|nr:hypothetical protein [Chthonobacter albigriseus]